MKLLWERLGYLAMSIFVAWHAAAIVLAAAPTSSQAVVWLRTPFLPYYSLFRLEASWGFFTQIPRGAQLRYIIHDAEGREHPFTPVDDFSWYHPRMTWFERRAWAILENPEWFATYFVELFCRQHAELKPVAITFQLVTEKEFWPEDQLRGHTPLDPEFVTIDAIAVGDCPQK